MPRIGIIGGTGVYDPKLLENINTTIVNTRYGEAKILTGHYQGEEMAFLPRHGADHSVPPHLVNFRANISALKQLGVDIIIATTAVGSLHLDLKPGEFVLSDQFLDFTKSRVTTFYEGGADGVMHCDMTVPYCPEVRDVIERTGQSLGLVVHNGGTYVCTEGPRFETPAEILMFKQLGGHIIGMTGVPEVCLAHELGICYAGISIVTNYAAGIAPGMLTHAEVVEKMKDSIADVRTLIMESAKSIAPRRSCRCNQILQETGMNK